VSLTEFLELPHVKKRFLEEFAQPKTRLSETIKAPPLTNHYGLVGTAFDYLLRFYIQRLNSNSIVSKWVAEEAVNLLKLKDKRLYLKGSSILERAQEEHSKYLKIEKINDSLIRSSLLLAQLDPVFRAGYIDPNLGVIEDQDTLDMKNLISLVDPKLFTAKKRCILNPTFGEGSVLVGGADADILIDDFIIDIKTVKDLKVTRKFYNQIIGYYILLKIGKVKGLASSKLITKLGFYFSRYGILYTIPSSNVENNPHLDSFIEWFKDAAKETYGI